MKKRIFRYLKHTLFTLLGLALSVICFGLYHGASLHYGDDPLRMDWDKDGPYVFFENDSILNINYIKGNKEDGFYLDSSLHRTSEEILAQTYFALDDSSFTFEIKPTFKTMPVSYDDGNDILAISDIESGYKTFRDFLIENKVIDEELKWTFGKGHLVLVGDFVDRGFSTTQVLWFIYKLEQESKIHGGMVHFIIGNHELKNMHGNFDSASPKYNIVASILGKTQLDLYGKDSFLGRWLSTKNTVELINGHLFTHGGIHPEVAETNVGLDELNAMIRKNYYRASFPKPNKDIEELLISGRTGPCWYRGYFKNDLSQEEVQRGLDKFNAKTIVVGHTLQSKVKRLYHGKVIGIDVKHPKDYYKTWPKSNSEGLLIQGDEYFRVFSDGDRKKFKKL
ncbi:MAG: metallophosphoesterase [Bacteroidota bacterium]